MDRNQTLTGNVAVQIQSLSARRAWIEILKIKAVIKMLSVALRKESVDRNPIAAFLLMWYQSRSPQGERG